MICIFNFTKKENVSQCVKVQDGNFNSHFTVRVVIQASRISGNVLFHIVFHKMRFQ